MYLSVIWETTPEELRLIADKMESDLRDIHNWGQDRVTKTVYIEDSSIQLRIGYPNELWNQKVKERSY